MTSAISVSGLHEIKDQFDILITDQFGVLHDGRVVYPGVLDCLYRLKSQGVKIAALSNSGRRADVNLKRMQSFGFVPDLFDVVLTSGEMAWLTLRDRACSFLAQSRRVFVVRGIGDATILDDLNFSIVSNTDDADFVLITGADQQRFPIEHYFGQLQPAMDRQLPCICANPDIHALMDGSTTYGPAAIAQHYASSGAEVVYFGKPHLPIYTKLIELLGEDEPSLDTNRILCVGDSPAHDIQGAQAAGLASALVSTGLQSMDRSVRHEGAAIPNYILPALVW